MFVLTTIGTLVSLGAPRRSRVDTSAVASTSPPTACTSSTKLRQLGPRLVAPHVKSLSGEADIFELRPRQGNSKPRPLVVRRGGGYLVVAVATDHANDMRRALDDARRRLKARGHLAK